MNIISYETTQRIEKYLPIGIKTFFYYNLEKKRKKNMSNDTHSKINKKKQLWKRLLLLKSKIIKERCFWTFPFTKNEAYDSSQQQKIIIKKYSNAFSTYSKKALVLRLIQKSKISNWILVKSISKWKIKHSPSSGSMRSMLNIILILRDSFQ